MLAIGLFLCVEVANDPLSVLAFFFVVASSSNLSTLQKRVQSYELFATQQLHSVLFFVLATQNNNKSSGDVILHHRCFSLSHLLPAVYVMSYCSPKECYVFCFTTVDYRCLRSFLQHLLAFFGPCFVPQPTVDELL